MHRLTVSFTTLILAAAVYGAPPLIQSPIPNPQSAIGEIPPAVRADMDWTARELAKLKRLPIPVYTWPLAPHMMEHPVFGHWLRVTGVCSGGLGAHHGWTDAQWQRCIKAVNRLDDMTMAFNYSPWQPAQKYLRAGETRQHAAETFDTRFLSELVEVLNRFEQILNQLDEDVKVVVIIDYEDYKVTDGELLTRKLNVIANGVWGVRSDVTIIWYGQCATPARQDRPKAFLPWLTDVANSGLGYCPLYHGGQFYRHGAIVEATWACAQQHGMTGLVVAYSPGSCWAETPWTGAGQPKRHWDYDCPYSLSVDWQTGQLITNEWFRKYPGRFPPWWKVEAIHLWPDPFDLKVDPPDFGLHATALFRGLHGLPLEQITDQSRDRKGAAHDESADCTDDADSAVWPNLCNLRNLRTRVSTP